MSCRFTVVILLLAVTIVSCGKVEESEPRGTWIGHAAGRNQKPGSFRETWTFKDGTIIRQDSRRIDAGPEISIVGQYSYKVDVAKEPKQIDITLQSPKKEEQARLGIYKIENDTLTYCYAKAGATRPENFEPWDRNDAQVITFRRKKDAPKKSEVPLEGQ